ncbi:MAG: (2Fe-2S) ferredoxin domain-containing protein [Prevotellaceae bacterium]|jgi:(2Fe-2S) ferredoxin|nr:(2Fe-2S) ferredoxin domain-containing protein [Prevotellaceae bacterium]
MKKPDFTILVCNSYRVAGDAQGFCSKQGAASLVQHLTEECSDRGINAVVTTTACFSVCSQGPVVVIQPNNYWYGEMTEDKLDEVLDALEEGKPVEEYLIA